jgi:hypothetical protein
VNALRSLRFSLSAPWTSSGRHLVLLLAVTLTAPGLLRAAPVSIAGSYENEGTVIASASAYRGPVTLRGLLGLEFDHALGVLRHAHISRVEINQRDDSLRIDLFDDWDQNDWHGRWRNNGGFEANADGVKFLLRSVQHREELILFTVTPVNAGAALLVRVQFVHASMFGPSGTEIGVFYFARREPAVASSVPPVQPVPALAAPRLRRVRP